VDTKSAIYWGEITPAAGRSDQFEPNSLPNSDDIYHLFGELAADQGIAYSFLEDGCYARAHLMCKKIMDCGFTPRKAWIFYKGSRARTPTPRKKLPGGVDYGVYHVAPVVEVKDGAQVEFRILDPSYFRNAVSIDEWRCVECSKTNLLITDLGVPPIQVNGGTGYWPGPDPEYGVDLHALQTMDKYLWQR
jgi:Glutaminase